MASPPTAMLTATEAAARIRDGTLSPVDLVRDAIRRIDALDGGLQAWVHVDRAGASLEARVRYEAMKHGGVAGALFGVPVGIKDIFDVAGMPTRAGAAAFAHRTPAEDATVVARLRAAGAIILGKTHTTQFAYADPAPTRNPWNLEHTPGGSSSGSAAAVAAGMAAVAIGSQTVGSVLRPAAYCGVVGLKPTHGRISTAGVVPLAWSLDHVGIFARSVADAAAVLEAVAGHDPADPRSSLEPVPGFPPQPLREPLTLGLPRAFYAERAGEEVKAHLEAVAARLGTAGARVEEVEMPATAAEILAISNVILRFEAARYHREQFAAHADDYGPGIRRLIEAGLETSEDDYRLAIENQGKLRRDISALFERVDALLLPVAPSTAPAGLESTGDPVFCAPASVSGLPSIALPSGLGAGPSTGSGWTPSTLRPGSGEPGSGRGGLPLAVQLVGAPFAEARLLGIAARVEQVLGFAASPPEMAAGKGRGRPG